MATARYGAVRMLKADGLCFSASPGRQIVRNISLDLESGHILGITGPSGAGKSTLFRLLSGLSEPDRGSVILDCIDLSSVAVARRPISYLQQSFPLYQRLSVMENVMVAFEGAQAGKPTDADFAKAEAMLDNLGIGPEMRDRYPTTLSGGESQRVAFAKAMLKPCRLLLLDEPFSNLDKKWRVRLGRLLRGAVQERGLMAIYISHDEIDLLLNTHTVAVMGTGDFVQRGPFEEIKKKPATEIVAGLGAAVGVQSILLADLPKSAGKLEIATAGAAAVSWLPTAGQAALIERTNIAPANLCSDRLILTGTVERTIEISGQRFTAFDCQTASGSLPMWLSSPENTVRARYRTGDVLRWVIERESLLSLDSAGGILS